MAQHFPEKHALYYMQEVIIFLIRFWPGQIKILASESWNAAVLESGPTNIVAGSVHWDNSPLPSLIQNTPSLSCQAPPPS